MEALAWVISLIATTFLGYFLRDIKNKVDALKTNIAEKVDKPKRDESKSIILDPDDIKRQAQLEHDAMMRQLNR